jgi:hypothetical protein
MGSHRGEMGHHGCTEKGSSLPRMYGLPWMRNGSSDAPKRGHHGITWNVWVTMDEKWVIMDAPKKGHHGLASNVWVTMDEKWVIMDLQCIIKAQQHGSR